MEPSTLILVAVAITVSVTVALWAAMIVTQHTSLEILEVKCSASEGKLRLSIANKGTAAATVIGISVEGRPIDRSLTLRPGEHAELELEAPTASAVEVVVRTTKNEYRCIAPVRG